MHFIGFSVLPSIIELFMKDKNRGESMSTKPRCFDLQRVSSQNFGLWKHSQTSPVYMCTRRRDRHEILAEILEAARGGAIKTHIMFKARLSYAQLNNFLPLLLEKGFLENATIQKHGKPTFAMITSEKGMRFLEDFRLLEI